MKAELHSLVNQFRSLELHAARAGRDVHQVLIKGLEQTSLKKGATTLDLQVSLRTMAAELLPVLPPYAPPIRRINDLLILVAQAIQWNTSVEETMHTLVTTHEMNSTPQNIAHDAAASLLATLKSPITLYTHTLSETVLNVVLILHSQGMVRQVYVTESRPNLDGQETARRLAEVGIKVYLTIDAAMPGAILASDRMLTGAETIGGSGDVIGKVGAFPAAVLCKLYNKPISIVADTTKILPIPLECLSLTHLRAKDLVLKESRAEWEPFGSYFDLTPNGYIDNYITEKGPWSKADVAAEANRIEVSHWLLDQLIAIQGE
ncbi:MAG: hypothetical protein NTZ74_05015 [Chloroflexi bacterium]|nr:hypothetical protein [Chloroflexota bacterium]